MFKRASSLKTRIASSFGVGAMALALVVGGAQGSATEDTAAQAQKESVSTENVALTANHTNWPYRMDVPGHVAYYWNPNTTSEAFARAVKDEFKDDAWANFRPASAYVYSPTTGKSYLMKCNHLSNSAGYVCTGGNNAEVHLVLAGGNPYA